MDDPEITHVAELVTDLFGALSAGDLSWLDRHLLLDEGAIHIGLGATHWSTARELLDRLREQFREEPAQWRLTDPVYLHRGGVVCVVGRPVVRFDDGSELPCRLTMVFLREDTWRLAHTHFSVAP